jgi:hypothetical protein
MTTLCLQGLVLDFNKCFYSGEEIIFIKSESISVSDNVGLMLDHGGKTFGHDNLEIHIGDESLAFRYELPASWCDSFKDQADEVETYLGVSAGLTITKSDTMTMDGHTVKVISAATLNEISLLSKEPAVKTAYARIVTADTCGDLSEDVEAGRLHLVGRVIGLLRQTKAAENGGVVKYSNSPSPYERAADRFERALKTLEIK